jgi:hypothetical protein
MLDIGIEDSKKLDHGCFWIVRIEAYINGVAKPNFGSGFFLNGLLVTAAHVLIITDRRLKI